MSAGSGGGCSGSTRAAPGCGCAAGPRPCLGGLPRRSKHSGRELVGAAQHGERAGTRGGKRGPLVGWRLGGGRESPGPCVYAPPPEHPPPPPPQPPQPPISPYHHEPLPLPHKATPTPPPLQPLLHPHTRKQEQGAPASSATSAGVTNSRFEKHVRPEAPLDETAATSSLPPRSCGCAAA